MEAVIDIKEWSVDFDEDSIKRLEKYILWVADCDVSVKISSDCIIADGRDDAIFRCAYKLTVFGGECKIKESGKGRCKLTVTCDVEDAMNVIFRLLDGF